MTTTASVKTISRRRADLHEVAYLRLVPLARQAEAIAARQPRAPVPPDVITLAEGVLFDARLFRARTGREKMPPAAPFYAALACQLGVALAELVAYENRHTHWDSDVRAFVWQVPGVLLPVRRLRAHVEQAATEARDAEQEQLSRQLERRINAITKGLDEEPVLARTYRPRQTPQYTYPPGPRIR